MIRVISLLVYAAGIIVALWMSKNHSSVQRIICIAIDGIAATILGLLPPNINPIIALYPMGFAMSIQWCTFRGVGDNPSATTFSTGNFRQLVSNIYNFFAEKNQQTASNIRFYLFTMLSFHIGIGIVYLIWPYITHYSIWIVFIPLLASAIQEYYMFLQKSIRLDSLVICTEDSKENIDV